MQSIYKTKTNLIILIWLSTLKIDLFLAVQTTLSCKLDTILYHCTKIFQHSWKKWYPYNSKIKINQKLNFFIFCRNIQDIIPRERTGVQHRRRRLFTVSTHPYVLAASGATQHYQRSSPPRRRRRTSAKYCSVDHIGASKSFTLLSHEQHHLHLHHRHHRRRGSLDKCTGFNSFKTRCVYDHW